MARKTERPKLYLSTQQRTKLEQLSKSQESIMREAIRAQVLLLYADQTPITQIQQLAKVSRPTIYKYIDRALLAGVDAGFTI